MKTVTFKYPLEFKFASHPVPASKAIPDYWKQASADPNEDGYHNGPWNTTVKSCLPFLDAMTQGYIIPLWADLHVKSSQNSAGEIEPIFTWGAHHFTVIEKHTPDQTRTVPAIQRGLGDVAFKFVSPYIIETPPGYSSLFVRPLNNAHEYIDMFSAVVSTDVYPNNINFPFAWTGPSDYEGVIPIGTPVIQVIPFKRVDFRHEVKEISEADDNLMRAGRNIVAGTFRGCYKRLWRQQVKSI